MTKEVEKKEVESTEVETPETVVAETEATQAQAQPQNIELTLNDLKALAQIIDLASTRGAFRANELAGVGSAYNKLTAFLAGVAASTKAAEETQESAEEDQGE